MEKQISNHRRLLGSDVHITSQNAGGKFRCYYPERIDLPLKDNESVIFIEDGRIFIQAWIEEGRYEEHDCASDKYQYYNRILVKTFSGETLSDEIGAFSMAGDGTWWIS